ncbi:hypothetical protein KAFR_0I01680 [Kazachstania africana CBS 2517]|uniref:DWNN domain-containing protein n=1 Tax=Kazachstania africana (strain ATCC 22294 / BCRC 22015 / CBS 2517 / CECT 1963 / NBRC 1671 / NRRL Y-8276) TaxID=1071382 RepID=H2AZZ9_KAZAF|nr:hypothetical protein KAFR_0I01680 [Kazachstania africana CBS 2517]CCF59949.1 hypothetical protein KAFR_0I01680 [Kazachstania africana CBS 2517]
MSSTIFYKFKSQNGSSRILFDGTGLTVFDLKREIIQNNKLGDGTDFQLRLYHPDTNEEYEEDQTVIPRSTSVIVKRSPAIKSVIRGKSIGNATRYITGKPRVHQNKKLQSLATTHTTNTGLSEEERIASMFANQENQWEQAQDEMSTATPVFFKNTNNNTSADDGPPPPGYMCYRCGARDHWIKNCPTNNDPNFEGKRIKRTTGIPKKFLKSVEIDPNNITPEEMAQRKIMVTDDGKFVVQVADEHSWEDYQRKQQKRLIDNDEAIWQKDHFTNLPDELKCPLTKGLLRDPVKTTNCCNKTFSKVAIENALLESDFICPSCNTHDILLDSLQQDTEKQKQVQLFLKENDHQQKRQKLTPTTNTATTTNVPTTTTNQPMPFPFPFPMFPPLPFIPNNKP